MPWRDLTTADIVKGAFAALGIMGIGVGLYIAVIRAADAQNYATQQLEIKLNAKIEALDIKMTGRMDRLDDRVGQDERTLDKNAASEAEALKAISTSVEKLDKSSRDLSNDFARISGQLSAAPRAPTSR